MTPMAPIDALFKMVAIRFSGLLVILFMSGAGLIYGQAFKEQNEISISPGNVSLRYVISYPSTAISPSAFLVMGFPDPPLKGNQAVLSLKESLKKSLLNNNIAIIEYTQSSKIDNHDPVGIIQNHKLHLETLINYIHQQEIMPKGSRLLGLGYGLLGSGMIQLAAQSPDKISNLILFDSPILPPLETILFELKTQPKAEKYSDLVWLQYQDMWQVILEICKRESNESAFKEQVNHVVENHLSWLDPGIVKDFGIQKKQILEEAWKYQSDSWKEYFNFDPLEHLSLIDSPVMIYFGKDVHPILANAHIEALDQMIFYLDKTNITVIKEELSKSSGHGSVEASTKKILDWVTQVLSKQNMYAD